MIDVTKLRMFCAMSRSFSFVQLGAGSSPARTRTGGANSAPATARAQVLAEFVLMHDPVIRLICASDRILRLLTRIIKPDDLIATLPDLGLPILRVGDGLSYSKEVLP
jgi:hypothetical protein